MFQSELVNELCRNILVILRHSVPVLQSHLIHGFAHTFLQQRLYLVLILLFFLPCTFSNFLLILLRFFSALLLAGDRIPGALLISVELYAKHLQVRLWNVDLLQSLLLDRRQMLV